MVVLCRRPSFVVALTTSRGRLERSADGRRRTRVAEHEADRLRGLRGELVECRLPLLTCRVGSVDGVPGDGDVGQGERPPVDDRQVDPLGDVGLVHVGLVRVRAGSDDRADHQGGLRERRLPLLLVVPAPG